MIIHSILHYFIKLGSRIIINDFFIKPLFIMDILNCDCPIRVAGIKSRLVIISLNSSDVNKM